MFDDGRRKLVLAGALICATGCGDGGPDFDTEAESLQMAAQNGGASGGASGSTNGGASGGASGSTNGGASGGANGGANGNVPPPLDLDVRRSLVVTEQPILERFAFERVLDQLVAQAQQPGLTSLALFQQWWDTRNPAPGLGLGPNCDSEISPLYGPALNGFPFDCRPAPAEGAQASCTSLADPNCSYVPIGLFNRFDLAAVDGATCGEYRIVYAKTTGIANNRDRNLIIFEAALLNPSPQQGLMGCRHIVTTWADLTKEDDIEARADALEEFYFEGRGNIPPVVHVSHFGDNALGVGQIRTNEFMQVGLTPAVWTLREVKLKKQCTGPTCELRATPVTVKNNPFGPLFDTTSPDPRAPLFQTSFIDSVDTLAAASLADIGMQTQDPFNSPQSHESGSTENNYVVHFGTAQTPFRAAISGAIPAGSGLSADDIVARAQTQSCAGCHRLSNNAVLGGGLIWPPSLGFTHVSERETEVVDGVTRFVISAALTDAFLPARKAVMEEYLLETPGKLRGTGRTIGGRETH